jgi:hypothetical protein
MTRLLEVPLSPSTAQKIQVTLDNTVYVAVFTWNGVSGCWIMDLYQADGTTPVLRGTPLVTGADLLSQYAYLELGGSLVALTIAVGHPPDEVPSFDDLGIDGHLYYVVP